MTTQTLLIDDRPTTQLSLGLPTDEAPALPASADLDLLHAALAYLGQIGREPAPQPRVCWRPPLPGRTAHRGRPGLGRATHRPGCATAVRIARLGLVLVGEDATTPPKKRRLLTCWPPAWPCRCITTGRRSTSGSPPVS